MLFLLELSRNLQKKGGWEDQSTVVWKGSGELPTPLSHYCALGIPSSLFSLKPPEFRHKLNFFGPPFRWSKSSSFHCISIPLSVASSLRLLKQSQFWHLFLVIIIFVCEKTDHVLLNLIEDQSQKNLSIANAFHEPEKKHCKSKVAICEY